MKPLHAFLYFPYALSIFLSFQCLGRVFAFVKVVIKLYSIQFESNRNETINVFIDLQKVSPF